MTVVVIDRCDGCRFTDCVSVCPVACFHTDGKMVYVDPVQCIDCTACIPACPVHAIFEERDLPPEFSSWKAINAERSAELPVIDEKTDPLPTANERMAELRQMDSEKQ